MTKSIITATFLSLALLIALLAGGCASTRIKHLPPKEFIAKAKHIEAMSSATWTTGTLRGTRNLEGDRHRLMRGLTERTVGLAPGKVPVPLRSKAMAVLKRGIVLEWQ